MGASNCVTCGRGLPGDARFCPSCGSPVSPDTRVAEREERKVVTALFADVVGSTHLGERLDPEDFRAVVGGAVSRMGEVVEELGGVVHGTAGDGILGLFGAPVAREDDPERAVLAGLRIVEQLDDYGRQVAGEWGIDPLAVRVGVETGLAVLGTVAAGSRASYEASGDCLNTAARLQGAAAPGAVLVGPLTHRLVAPLFDWAEPRALTLKGKAEPVIARDVRAALPAARRRGATTVRSRLVGRDRELALAEEAVADVRAGNGRVVVVTGEAGMGKTRLIGEMRALFGAADATVSRPRWLEGHCVSYAGDEPYLPFREVLGQALGDGMREPRGPAEIRKLTASLLGEDADQVASILSSVMGVTRDPSDAAQLESISQEALQHRVVEAVAKLFERLTERGPVTVVLDDLHWADASSIRLASGLLAAPERMPLLLVIAMRPEPEHASWRLRELALSEHADRACELALERLPLDAERSLVAELIGAGTLPGELERQFLERSEGNPFYLEELVRSLLDSGALARVGDGWRFDREAPFELPETVERVILARIDRLKPANRDVLAASSVLGRRFELPLLRLISGEVGSPDAALPELERLGLIEEETPGFECRFKHPLIQEAAYNGLLRRRRTELHSRAAAAIVELHGGTEEHYPALARHHSAAGNVEAAARYHGLAGRMAQRMYAVDEALGHFDAALAATAEAGLEPGDRAVVELQLARGLSHARRGDLASGVGDVRAALDGAKAAGDRALEMQAVNELGMLIRGTSYDEAIGYLERALEAAEELGDEATQVSALSRLSLIHSNQLRLDRALELGDRALEIARRAGDDRMLGLALDGVKLAALQIGDLERLESSTSEMAVVQRRVGDFFYLQWALLEAAFVPLGRGRHEEAIARIDAASEVNSRVHDRLTEAMILETRSWIERSRGDLDAALAAVRRAMSTVEDLGTPEWIAWVGASHGSHLLQLPASAEAAPVLERALEAAEKVGTPNRIVRAAGHLAWARCLLGDLSGARQPAEQAEVLLAAATAPPGAVFLNGYHAYLAVARTWLALGEPERAERLLGPLLDAARTAGWIEAAAYASVLLGHARRDLGDREGAASLLSSALDMCRQSELPGPAGEAHAAVDAIGA